jgi:transcription elongation factor GreA
MTFPITPDGHQRLQEELHLLKVVKRPAVIRAIAEARAHGDLKENAEYHAAKEEQSFIEGRIQELESKIALANIIDIDKLPKDKVYFGSKVKVVNLDTDEKMIFQIVSEEESDIKAGKINNTSPLGKSLISKTKGDIVAVQTPRGLKEYEILKIM